MDASLVIGIVLTSLTSIILLKLGYLLAKVQYLEKRIRRIEMKIDKLNGNKVK